MSTNVTLEPSEGTTIPNPSREQIRSTLNRIGAGLDHCILNVGGEVEFLQAAGDRRGLLVQYRDASGMHESARSDLDAATVERIFVDAMGGSTAWKAELSFRPMDTPGVSAGAAGSPRGAPSSTKPSGEPDLLDAAKRAAKTGVDRLLKKGIRGLFGGKL